MCAHQTNKKTTNRNQQAESAAETDMATISTTWSDERIALLKILFERGCTCREMACEIGVSRNAVIGKLARLNLTRGRAARVWRAAPPRPRGARPLQLLLKAHVEDEAAGLRASLIEALPIEQGPGCSLMELELSPPAFAVIRPVNSLASNHSCSR